MALGTEKSSRRSRRQRTKPVTVTDFEQWEAKQASEYNFEFYYGEIIKKTGIRQSEARLAGFLITFFWSSKAKELGILFQESDIYIDNYRKRIADLAYFSHQQIAAMDRGHKEVPLFVIELLSKSESFEEVEEKLQDYFDAGVQLVWYISPKSRKIYAYTPQNKVQVYVTGTIASANDMLPGFEIDIDQLFTIA